jgi:hypothetical protein
VFGGARNTSVGSGTNGFVGERSGIAGLRITLCVGCGAVGVWFGSEALRSPDCADAAPEITQIATAVQKKRTTLPPGRS